MSKKRSKKQVYAFIDSQNLNVSVQKIGWKMDWRKFRKFLQDKYGVTKAMMFIGYVPEFEDMYMQLHEAGYAVVLKPTFDMTKPRTENDNDGNGDSDTKDEDRHVKGNIDADLVLWAMKEFQLYDQAVLVSGDGDFYSLVEYLVEKNKLKKLLAPSAHYSNLYNRYEKFIDRIDHHKKELAYYDKKNRKNSNRKK